MRFGMYVWFTVSRLGLVHDACNAVMFCTPTSHFRCNSCESTCESTLYTCGVIGYHCQNGNATDFLNGICSAPSSLVGDGFCDAFFFTSSAHINTNACEWDGGDWCVRTTMRVLVHSNGSSKAKC